MNVRRGSWTSLREDHDHKLRVDPASGVYLRLSHIQFVGWKRNPNPLVEHRTVDVSSLSRTISYTKPVFSSLFRDTDLISSVMLRQGLRRATNRVCLRTGASVLVDKS
jgi:hypothetical protein